MLPHGKAETVHNSLRLVYFFLKITNLLKM